MWRIRRITLYKDMFMNTSIHHISLISCLALNSYILLIGGFMRMTNNNLKDYFPLIRERKEVLAEIEQKQSLKVLFYSWTTEQQEEFLDFCTGTKGVKMLYDSFLKEVLNAEYNAEPLNDFLSVLLQQKVRILHILPNESVRIADETSLIITDIVVELEDGSIANVEIQKIGYKFPGERAACYSADLLLRQYKRVRGKEGKKFTYRSIKPVYTIVLFEQSPSEFREFPNNYLHHVEPVSDTGIELELLQKYIFIPLDIFKKKRQNEVINNRLDAWLTFLCRDEPEYIIQLITRYPEFKPLYETIYQMCENVEKVMEMFSKELQLLDQNTVQYMIDEMQDTIDYLQQNNNKQEDTINLLQQSNIEQQNKINSLEQEKVQHEKALQEALKRIKELEKNQS